MENEKRLIDANALLSGICKDCGNGCDLENSYCLLATEIMKALTVDAVEVVHGRWVHKGAWHIECSECQYILAHIGEAKNYCPNCGAKMDGDGNG